MVYVGDVLSDGVVVKLVGMLVVGVNWGSYDLREEVNARNFYVVFDMVEEFVVLFFDD